MSPLFTLLLACGPKSAPGTTASPGTATAPRTPAAAGLPARPEDIAVQQLDYTPPDASAFRGTFQDVPVFVAEAHSLPVVHLDLVFQGGAYLAKTPGLSDFTARLMRSGGTEGLEPRALDDALDQIAAEVDVAIEDDHALVSATCLASNLARCVELTFDVVRHPRFDAERFRLEQDSWRARVEHRNDDARTVQDRTWRALLWGEDHPLGRSAVEADVDGVDVAAVRALHGAIFHPGNLWIGVSGDTDRAAMEALLEPALSGWERKERAAEPSPPTQAPSPGFYHVQKEIPQGKVRFGHRLLERDHPDALALEVMNFTLGSGGFVSRITSKVRTEEGLAYTARSAVWPGVHQPGELRLWTESKSETVALATKLMWAELDRIRTEPVTDQELMTAKAAFRAFFPRKFESRQALLRELIEAERTGLPADHWQTYLARLDAVTKEDVQRVAAEHLKPEQLVLLIVGDWDPIAAGDLEKRASAEDFYDGAVQHLEPR